VLDFRIPTFPVTLSQLELLPANLCSEVEFPVAVKGLFYVTWWEQRTIEAHAPEHLHNPTGRIWAASVEKAGAHSGTVPVQCARNWHGFGTVEEKIMVRDGHGVGKYFRINSARHVGA
jgi:hypothetical protein